MRGKNREKQKKKKKNSGLLGFIIYFISVLPKHSKKSNRIAELDRRHRRGKDNKRGFSPLKITKKSKKFTGALDGSHRGPRTTAKSCCTKESLEYGNTAEVRLMKG